MDEQKVVQTEFELNHAEVAKISFSTPSSTPAKAGGVVGGTMSPGYIKEAIIKLEKDHVAEHYFLCVNQDVWENSRESATRDPNVRHDVISFLGKTHAGKSTIIKALLTAFGCLRDSMLPQTAKKGSKATTAGILLYGVPRLGEEKCTVAFADYEGEDGGRPAEASAGDSIDCADDDSRRRVTKIDMRRLAYISSQLIVYVCEGSMANHAEFYERIADFARRAVEDISNADKPMLMIIANKCNMIADLNSDGEPVGFEEMEDYLSPTKTTAEFFDERDPDRSILNFFEGLSVIRLPLKDMNLKLSDESRVDTSLLYDRQIRVIAQEVERLLKEKAADRELKGNIMNEFLWLSLLKQLVAKRLYRIEPDGSKTIRNVDMCSTLLNLMSLETSRGPSIFFDALRQRQQTTRYSATESLVFLQSKEYTRQDQSLVHRAYEGTAALIDNHSIDIDLLTRDPSACLAFATNLLLRSSAFAAVFNAIRNVVEFQKHEFSRNDILTTKREEIWTEIILPAVRDIYRSCRMFSPCCATYADPKGSYSPILCEVLQKNHGRDHMSDTRHILVYKKDESGVEGLVEQGKNLVRKHWLRMDDKSRADRLKVERRDAVWPGGSGYRELASVLAFEDVEDCCRDQFNRTIDRMRSTDNTTEQDSILLASQAMLTHSAFSHDQLPNLSVDCDNHCLVCLLEFDVDTADAVNLMCSHVICRRCFEFLRRPVETMSPLVKEAAIEGVVYIDVCDKCPFCKAGRYYRDCKSKSDLDRFEEVGTTFEDF